MEDLRSKSCGDGRMQQIENYSGPASSYGNGIHSMQDLRCYSASYASTVCHGQTQMPNNDAKLKKGKSTNGSASKSWGFNDPELQRKKRVAGYKVYAVEGKVKGSFKKSFRWIKDSYSKTSYPRTPAVRKTWVVHLFIKLIIFTGLMGFIIEQYINPIVQHSQHPLNGNLLYALERVLKLSVPNLYVWLCMFYCFFHLWLNILAELLRFGDREFYKDWWNAKNVEEYWRKWNTPVHKWIVRHIYLPCIRNGIPKGVAVIIAFLVSAVFHELCIAVPCHIFKLWAFIGIMFQVPLVLITNYLQNKFRSSMVGSMIFWFIFCILGQPMCVLLYYHDFMNRKGKAD